MERVRLNSTNLESAAYDADAATLEIVFVSGSLYEYYEVPHAVFRSLASAPSPGQYLTQNIKDVYRYRRLQ